MGGSQKKQAGLALQRQLTLLIQLMQRDRGMTLVEVQQAMTLPKATFFRYLQAFKAAGIDIDHACVVGQTRYSVPPHLRQAFALSPQQLDALRVARRRVDALEGTHVTQALDALIRTGQRKHTSAQSWIRARKGRASGPDHLSQLERAFSNGRRVVIRYRGERDSSPRQRVLDPILLRHVGEHVYLHAFDVEQAQQRTFKLSRISLVEIARERAGEHQLDEQVLARSIKTWLGDPVSISVRLSPRVARIADEYRLTDNQVLVDEPDGGARVTATVNGIQEATRWVLSWGADAEALEPKSLRDAVAQELNAAAAQYASNVSVTRKQHAWVSTGKVAAKKTRRARSTSLTDRETAAE